VNSESYTASCIMDSVAFQSEGGSVLIHTVLMRFDTSADADETVRLLARCAEIDVVRRLEVGRNVSQVASSYDVGLVMEFDSADDLRAYLSHPLHEAAGEFSRPRRTAIASCDLVSSPGGAAPE